MLVWPWTPFSVEICRAYMYPTWDMPFAISFSIGKEHGNSLVTELKLTIFFYPYPYPNPVCFTHSLVPLRRKWESKKDALIGLQEEEKHWGYN